MAAGVVISASHNPWTDNGIKVFSGDGFKLTDARELAIEKEIFALLENATAADDTALKIPETIVCPAKPSCVMPMSSRWRMACPRI